jgi:hypothetical protein
LVLDPARHCLAQSWTCKTDRCGADAPEAYLNHRELTLMTALVSAKSFDTVNVGVSRWISRRGPPPRPANPILVQAEAPYWNECRSRGLASEKLTYKNQGDIDAQDDAFAWYGVCWLGGVGAGGSGLNGVFFDRKLRNDPPIRP